jgi:predicted PurR-regulated permease PerM
MTVREKALAWLLILVGFLLLVWLFQPILLPFVAGLAVAYFLDPVADWLEARGVGRGWAAVATLLSFAVLAVAMLLLLVPVIQSQIVGLVGRLPDLIGALQRWMIAWVDQLQGVLDPADFERLRSAMTAEIGRGVNVVTGLVRGVFAQGMAVFEFVSLLLVTPVVAFYLLRDWDNIVARIDGLLPRQHQATVREQARAVDETLAGFVRGQASVCVLLGLGYGGALALVGLPFGFTVGLLAGMVSFIPYVGSIFGLIASVGLALVEFDDPARIGIVAAIFVVGQLIEGNVLTPKLVGEKVNLHPVWIIFALFAGGSLMGFVGMLIALPVAAVVGVGVRFLVGQYKLSRLYDHEAER